MENQYAGFSTYAAATMAADVSHREASEALRGLGSEGYYCYDVTQPMGLGTPLARTFVTRTLVGEPGITYKYLGLREFAHPWSGDALERYPADARAALRGIFLLNEGMKRRARRSGFGEGSVFNLTLINRMAPRGRRDALEPSRALKAEPLSGDACSVSWHADSSLEHFSTIGVYHMTDDGGGGEDNWRVALRVALDAEGPQAGRARRGGRLALDAGAPAVCVRMPDSGSAYFMFGAFNHHHQHAVLAGDCDRWASTHRVSRVEGHTVQSVVERAEAVLREERRTLKQWRGQARALDEIEFEWLRQYFVQGARHDELHAPYWRPHIDTLCALWRRLEEREARRVDTLRGAHRALCSAADACRSEQRRWRKQLDAVRAMGAAEALSACLEDLRARQRRRELWQKREGDALWRRLPRPCRPLALPLFRAGEGAEGGRLPEDLRPTIKELEACAALLSAGAGGAAAARPEGGKGAGKAKGPGRRKGPRGWKGPRGEGRRGAEEGPARRKKHA